MIESMIEYLNQHCHRLDLGPHMLLGAQQHTTVETAAALKTQDKIEGKYDENMQNTNGQYRNEMYKRVENMVPQLDGTFNITDDSDSDLHSYLDLASSNIIAYKMRGQKQRHGDNKRANTNRHSALKEYVKPNTNVNLRRHNIPDDEDKDINKIVQCDRPKDDRNSALNCKAVQRKRGQKTSARIGQKNTNAKRYER